MDLDLSSLLNFTVFIMADPYYYSNGDISHHATPLSVSIYHPSRMMPDTGRNILHHLVVVLKKKTNKHSSTTMPPTGHDLESPSQDHLRRLRNRPIPSQSLMLLKTSKLLLHGTPPDPAAAIVTITRAFPQLLLAAHIHTHVAHRETRGDKGRHPTRAT